MIDESTKIGQGAAQLDRSGPLLPPVGTVLTDISKLFLPSYGPEQNSVYQRYFLGCRRHVLCHLLMHDRWVDQNWPRSRTIGQEAIKYMRMGRKRFLLPLSRMYCAQTQWSRNISQVVFLISIFYIFIWFHDELSKLAHFIMKTQKSKSPNEVDRIFLATMGFSVAFKSCLYYRVCKPNWVYARKQFPKKFWQQSLTLQPIYNVVLVAFKFAFFNT